MFIVPKAIFAKASISQGIRSNCYEDMEVTISFTFRVEFLTT